MADLHVVATLVSQDGKADELRAILLSAVEQFRQEDGCLAYTLLEDRKQPGRFVTHECWRDEAALAAHMKTPLMAKLAPRLPELLDGEMQQDLFDPLLVL